MEHLVSARCQGLEEMFGLGERAEADLDVAVGYWDHDRWRSHYVSAEDDREFVAWVGQADQFAGRSSR